MQALEGLFIQFLLNFVSADQINAFLGDPRTAAILVGILVSASAACLGVFLLLRKMSMTADAISHTVLLGIVVAFLLMVGVLHLSPDLDSPLLLIGAGAAGVATVFLTELVFRSRLVRQDAALGLIFPLLFAIAIILISRFADNVHLDTDAVLVGEIGMVWANTNSHCLAECDPVVITQEDPRARTGRRCINCQSEGITPRDPRARFETVCVNCGTYTAAEAWRERLIDTPPQLIYWPKSLTVMAVITLINIGFITLFYKELKLAAFDPALASALGFRPGLITYALIALASLTAVGAFDAVGSVTVVAFFIIPAAAAYLLTDRLALMLLISPLLGALAAFTGYELARGSFLGLLEVSSILMLLDKLVGLDGYTTWNTSISASMVMMAFFFFIVAWVISPRYGLVSTVLRRRNQQQNFAVQLILGHIFHHQNSPGAADELALSTLHQHLNWTPEKTRRLLRRVHARGFIQLDESGIRLTERGRQQVLSFRHANFNTN